MGGMRRTADEDWHSKCFLTATTFERVIHQGSLEEVDHVSWNSPEYLFERNLFKRVFQGYRGRQRLVVLPVRFIGCTQHLRYLDELVHV